MRYLTTSGVKWGGQCWGAAQQTRSRGAMRAVAALGVVALVLTGTGAAAWSASSHGPGAAAAGRLEGTQPTATKSGAVTISIELAWAASPGATGYTIQRTGGTGTAGGTCVGTVTTTSCSDTPVMPATIYTYTITPVRAPWIGTPGPATTITT